MPLPLRGSRSLVGGGIDTYRNAYDRQDAEPELGWALRERSEGMPGPARLGVWGQRTSWRRWSLRSRVEWRLPRSQKGKPLLPLPLPAAPAASLPPPLTPTPHIWVPSISELHCKSCPGNKLSHLWVFNSASHSLLVDLFLKCKPSNFSRKPFLRYPGQGLSYSIRLTALGVLIHFPAFPIKLQSPWEQRLCLVSASHQTLHKCRVKNGPCDRVDLGSFSWPCVPRTQTLLTSKGRTRVSLDSWVMPLTKVTFRKKHWAPWTYLSIYLCPGSRDFIMTSDPVM